jgi:hypothetical protein
MRTPILPIVFFQRWQWLVLVLVGALGACTDKYLPDVISAPQSFLVVDGFLNTQGMTTIKLTRTFAVASKEKPPVETRATLAIEEQAGPRFALQETDKGTYASANLALSPGKNYRLLITTLAGQQYASDFVPAKITPPIDSVSWRTGPTGLKINVSTHDETNSTHYYRWKYEETWEIVPGYTAILQYVNHQMRALTVPYPTVCWSTVPSTTIQLNKTTALAKDVVAEFPIRLLTRDSDRLLSRYSILVQQHALTLEEYTYWSMLGKNTENIGTLFDPQPVQLKGNMHCLSDDKEIALGYVGAHSLQEQRIFINRAELPADWPRISGNEYCSPPDTVELRYVDVTFSYPTTIPVLPIYTPQGTLKAYTKTSLDCVDCRLRGTAVKPSFW